MTIPISPSNPVVPITNTSRQTALSFARQQPTREKARQVYRNTLAVLIAKHCLDLLEIPTDLAASDCWNPFTRLAADIADLQVIGLGHLECRPVSPDEQGCYVPPEVLENRIGYLVVQLDQAYREATILGFSSSVLGESLSLKQLHPIEELLIHLELLNMQSLRASQTVAPLLNHLSQWFNISNTGNSAWERTWQTVEALLKHLPEPAFAFRTFPDIALDIPERIQQMVDQLYASQCPGHPRSPDIKVALVHLIQTTTDEETRWKAAEILWTIDPGHPASGIRRVLDLGLMFAKQPLALMVAILEPGLDAALAPENRFSILARVYPMTEQSDLPAGLQLAILGADGSVGLETQARKRDNYIQLKLRGEFGEQFSIRLRLDADVLTEYFVI
ncbi:MAG: hypothetical protein NVSMB70_14860 [Chamaesiphon sp.]